MAELQVTAEQILHDAYQNRTQPLSKVAQTVQDLDELRAGQIQRRKEYELQLNKNRLNFGQWIRYARWEVSENHDFKRARSIYERALLVNVEHVPFWTNYVQMELSHKNVNHARNILERAVTTLPRVDKFWYLYVQTEEALANFDMVRVIFERWIEWQPPVAIWEAYIAFEKRYLEIDRARGLFERLLAAHMSASTWLKWCKFEVSLGDVAYIRRTFEGAMDHLVEQIRKTIKQEESREIHSSKQQPNTEYSPSNGTQLGNETETRAFLEIVDRWTNWERSLGELDRARAIFQLLKDHLKPTDHLGQSINDLYTQFEKVNGQKQDIVDLVHQKRKAMYKKSLDEDPTDYDTWWTYLHMLEGTELENELRRAVTIAPLVVSLEREVTVEKSLKSLKWRRYVYLWIKLAFYFEFDKTDIDAARDTWKRAVASIPKQMTFGKLWIYYSEFELRNGGISESRKVLGRAIGLSLVVKPKIFKHYIALETKLGEWDRVRMIYQRWIILCNGNVASGTVFINYLQFEGDMGESERVDALVDICFLPELAWTEPERVYEDIVGFYSDDLQYEKAREVWERSVSSVHVGRSSIILARLWIKYAVWECKIPTEEQLAQYHDSGEDEFEFSLTEKQISRSRAVFRRAFDALEGNSEARVRLLDGWKQFETEQGSQEEVEAVERMYPRIERAEDGTMEYVFEKKKPVLSKFLANAKKWAAEKSN